MWWCFVVGRGEPVVDTREAKQRLVSAFTKLIEEGMSVDDILDAVQSSVEHHKAMSNGISNPRDREEQQLFYGDVITILVESKRRVGVARRSAKSIAG